MQSSLWTGVLTSSFMALYSHRNPTAYQGQGKNEMGSESPGPHPCSHSSWALTLRLLLPWCFTATETVRLIRDRRRMRWGVRLRAQAHFPVHTAPELWLCVFFFHGALQPQKQYGLSGTGEEWDGEWEPWPTSLFTQLLSSKQGSLKKKGVLKGWSSVRGSTVLSRALTCVTTMFLPMDWFARQRRPVTVPYAQKGGLP